MKVIAGPRGSGKTTELIKLSAETGSRIVTKNKFMANFTVDMAKKANLEIPTPLTYDEYLEEYAWQGRKETGFLIDDLDIFLLHVCPSRVPIKAVCISSTEVMSTEMNCLI